MAVNTKARTRVFWVCVLASLGGLLFGLDQGFINGSLGFIQKTFKWTTAQGESLFFFFSLFCLLGFVLIGKYTPETKGVSLEALETNLKNGEKLRDLGCVEARV
jgi:hypothetical protein